MKKIKAFLKAFADTFCELAQKVDNGTADENETTAYGCLYVIIAFVFIIVFIIAVAVCCLIWHLL